MAILDNILSLAEQEVGYLEKRTNAHLDEKTANAGDKNYNKYADYLIKVVGAPYVQAQPWCDMFVDYLFVKVCGKDKAKQLLGNWSAYTPSSANYYKQMNRWYSTPQVGDQIFFKNSTRICHTGIVYKVDSRFVYTIEGNTSSSAGVVPNGGGVFKKQYLLSNSRIAGYGRPNYSSTPLSHTDNPYAEPTQVLKKGSKGEGVYWMQYELREAGYEIALD